MNSRKATFILIVLALISWVLVTMLQVGKEVMTILTEEPVYADERMVWNEVNNWRIAEGKSAYTEDPMLCGMAALRSEEIISDFNHNGFIEHITQIRGDRFASIGENLSRGYSNEKELLQAWLDSPKHRENLEADFTYSCINCEYSYCVQLFGSETILDSLATR